MLFSLLPAMVATYFLVIGTVVLFRAKAQTAKYPLVALCVTTFFWQMSWALLFQVQNPDLAMVLVKTGYLLIIFLPTTLYHFLVEISKEQQERRLVKLSYGFAAVLAGILLFTDAFVSGTYSHYWGFYPKAGPIHPMHVLQTFLVISRGLLIVYRKQRLAAAPYRSQLRYCLVSVFIYALAAVDYLCNYGLEFYPPGIIFVSVGLTIIAYAVVKKELLDIKFVITSVVARMVTLLLVSLSFVVINLFPWSDHSSMLVANVFVAAFWGRYVTEFRRRLQTSSEKRWVRGWYDPDEVTSSLAQKLYPLLDDGKILHTVADHLAHIFFTRKYYVVLNKNTRYYCYENDSDELLLQLESNPFEQELKHCGASPADLCELAHEVKPDPRISVHAGSMLLFFHAAGNLRGVIALGERKTAMPYSKRDKQVLFAVIRKCEIFLAHADEHSRLMAEARALHDEKLLLTKAIAGNIAHELRTPLTTISMTTRNINKYIPLLWEGYETGLQYAYALEQNTKVKFDIPAHRRRILASGIENIGRSVSRAQTMVTLLLNNVRHDVIDTSTFQHYSVQACVDKALDDYPFLPHEAEKVNFNRENDFVFLGSDTLFMYALFNLIKNSLYYIAKAGKGEIFIRLEQGLADNTLYFKDTGFGIPVEVLPRIFEDFFTTNPQEVGSGLGLSFCRRVIDSFGGSIECFSQEGEYTEFAIKLPQTQQVK